MNDQRPTIAYADQVWQGTCDVVEHCPVARDTYRIRLRCPTIARHVLPGQFLMVRLARCNDPLLGRPLAMYSVAANATGEPEAIDIVYQVVGKMTERLAALPAGTTVEAWGPLGNGFPPESAEHLVMVAGGIGQTPFLSLARESLGLQTYGEPARQVPRARKVTLCYGARTLALLACVDNFRQAGVDVSLSTDDGSAGHHGLATDLIEPAVEAAGMPSRLVCCGPERMLATAAETASRLGLPCQVSLETPMACGLGICFSCVTKVRDGSGHWDYRRTCVEGPIFDARNVEFGR